MNFNNIGAKTMKHPINRRVFFTRQRNDFLSLNEVRTLARTGKLAMTDLVFDTDGGSYTTGSIVQGKAPRWALSTEHDPLLCDLPIPSPEDVAMVNEVLCEAEFLEMPTVPSVKSVKDFLSRKPQVARMVANAERWMFQ
jgi:hypothetical protein